MTIGNTLFASLTTESLSRMQTSIADLQERIASGKVDPRPSTDTVRALRLSAADDLRSSIDRYAANAKSATARLDLTDTVLGEVSNITRKLREVALQSINGTMSSEGARGLKIEAQNLREALFTAANTRDAQGQPLFSGYGAGDAFAQTADGVVFVGDAGRSALRLSESLTVTTSLNGAEVFSGGPGRDNLFTLVDDLIASLGTSVGASVENVQSDIGSALLTVPAAPGVVEFGFTLQGPAGSADIRVPMAANVPGPMIDAINASAADTGVTASLAADGQSIQLTSFGPLTLTNGQRSDQLRESVVALQPLDAAGQPDGNRLTLRPSTLLVDSVIGGFAHAIDNLAAKRAEAGALGAVVEQQTETLAARKLQVDLSIANLEEIDMAATVTELQSLLLSQEAAQQSFVRIRSTGLFDFLR